MIRRSSKIFGIIYLIHLYFPHTLRIIIPYGLIYDYFSTGKGTTYRAATITDIYDLPTVEKFPDLVKASNICAAHAQRTYTFPGVKYVRLFYVSILEYFYCVQFGFNSYINVIISLDFKIMNLAYLLGLLKINKV